MHEQIFPLFDEASFANKEIAALLTYISEGQLDSREVELAINYEQRSDNRNPNRLSSDRRGKYFKH